MWACKCSVNVVAAHYLFLVFFGDEEDIAELVELVIYICHFFA